MIVLGMDTSTMTGGVALVNEEGLIGEYVLNIRATHSERLLPAVHQILQDANVALQDVDGIAVVTGPGSFTGLRIGVATAQGFHLALETRLLGVTTLAALAWQFQWFPGLICPLIDARRQEVYTQMYRGRQPVTEPLNVEMESVLNWCQDREEPILFVGDGALIHEDWIKERVMQAVFPSPEGSLLRASSVAGYGLALFLQGESHDPTQVIPFYMRKSEAEIKWEKHFK